MKTTSLFAALALTACGTSYTGGDPAALPGAADAGIDTSDAGVGSDSGARGDALGGPDAVEEHSDSGPSVDAGPSGDGGALPPVDAGPTPLAPDHTWCSPRAIPYDMSQIAAMPDAIQLDTLCEDSAPSFDVPEGNSAASSTVWNPSERVLEIENGGLGVPGAQIRRLALGEDDAVLEVYLAGSAGFYDTSYGETWYELNEWGQLDHKVAVSQPYPGAPEQEWTVLDKDQVWSARSLERRVERDGEDGPILREFIWEYDEAGRLIAASADDQSVPDVRRRFATTYAYDEGGNISLLQRTVNDVVVFMETWTWQGDDLLSRTAESISMQALAAEHGGDAWQWAFPGGLDDFELQNRDFQSDPWAAANPTSNGDCMIPPRGVGHGYPDSEPEYHLAVAATERPNGIGFAYGSDTYGWNYGDLSWYGHDGIGTRAAGLMNEFGSTWAEVEYDEAGRMVHEALRVDLTDGRTGSYTRQRQYNGAWLQRDVVSGAIGDIALPDRALRFERDAAGNMVRRSLWEQDEEIEAQTWTYDAQSRVTAHVVPVTTTADDRGSVDGWFALIGGFDTSGLGGEWTWTYDDTGRLIERAGRDQSQTWTYDGQGRVEEVRGYWGWHDDGDRRLRYDDQDRVVERCIPWTETEWYCTESTFDERGRLHATTTLVPGNAPQVVWHEFRCE